MIEENKYILSRYYKPRPVDHSSTLRGEGSKAGMDRRPPKLLTDADLFIILFKTIEKQDAELNTTKKNLSDCLKQNTKQEGELKDLRDYRDNNEGIPKKWRRRRA